MVDPQRFELWEDLTPRRLSRPVHSTNSAKDPRVVTISFKTIKLEVPPRFELGIVALQATALPLGDGTSYLFIPWCPEPDLNRHSIATGGF
jgi:hypothetical protein